MRALISKPKNGHSVKGCSDCVWTFEPKDPPMSGNLAILIENFESRQQEEFEKHDCSKHPKGME